MRGSQVSGGKVYLVGAGPGDPGLLTLKGREVLSRADVVVYDYLANEELLRWAPPTAQRIYVGKKGGDHTVSQEDLNRLLVEKGRENLVVRLKGGDPFVFGRGGEEAQMLAGAGIPFEVVPGVTAAVAVPAYAGIPLSHRDYTASMAFVTGHERDDKEDSKIEWAKLSTAVGTLVFFMGVKNLPEICRRLVENGRPSTTPVAAIRWGTLPEQQTVTGTLDDIVEKVRQAQLKPPAILIVGEVVRLREELNWFERRPLFGRTVLVTRAREQASDFKTRLEELGACCIEFPTIDIRPPASWEPLDQAIGTLAEYDWVMFTSVNGVHYFMERLWTAGLDARALGKARLAAIGPRTADALRANGLRPDLVPREYRAESILEGLSSVGVKGKSFLIPRALVARDVLPETLRREGARVNVVPAYETVLPSDRRTQVLDAFRARRIHCVTFTSSSTVSNFFQLCPREEVLPWMKEVDIACIGPITAETAREYGLRTNIMPGEYTIAALTEAILAHYR
ncbi:MAG TPA: uroporphyrinogen-III C-methyltransferase [Syntrophobacteraceae bacterium]|nr:uroporphyrinogen-III C-methyltransferase [Syntrophobacteraceae bacterium]